MAAFAPSLGLDRDTALKIASGFGGGMGRLAETCGTVTGAFMVLGLAHCDASCSTAEGREAVSGAVSSFAGKFSQRHGSLVCRELLACDISTPEGAKAAQEQGLFDTKCVELVRDAAVLLESMLPGGAA